MYALNDMTCTDNNQAWLRYHTCQQKKKHRIFDALEARKQRLCKQGVAKWIEVCRIPKPTVANECQAMSRVRTMRLKAAVINETARETRALQLAQKYARKWIFFARRAKELRKQSDNYSWQAMGYHTNDSAQTAVRYTPTATLQEARRLADYNTYRIPSMYDSPSFAGWSPQPISSPADSNSPQSYGSDLTTTPLPLHTQRHSRTPLSQTVCTNTTRTTAKVHVEHNTANNPKLITEQAATVKTIISPATVPSNTKQRIQRPASNKPYATTFSPARQLLATRFTRTPPPPAAELTELLRLTRPKQPAQPLKPDDNENYISQTISEEVQEIRREIKQYQKLQSHCENLKHEISIAGRSTRVVGLKDRLRTAREQRDNMKPRVRELLLRMQELAVESR